MKRAILMVDIVEGNPNYLECFEVEGGERITKCYQALVNRAQIRDFHQLGLYLFPEGVFAKDIKSVLGHLNPEIEMAFKVDEEEKQYFNFILMFNEEALFDLKLEEIAVYPRSLSKSPVFEDPAPPPKKDVPPTKEVKKKAGRPKKSEAEDLLKQMSGEA